MGIETYSSDWIKTQIQKSETRHREMEELYKRYQGKNLAIEKKQKSKSSKANYRLKTNYRGMIIDQSVGYLLGNPLNVGLDDRYYDGTRYQLNNDFIQRFMIVNDFSDFMAESGVKTFACGYTSWLCYIDTQGETRVKEIAPWQTIFTDYGNLWVYAVEEIENGEIVEKTKVEIYDDTYIYFFDEVEGEYILNKETPFALHQFDVNPLIKVKNNEEEIGDFEKVESYIDAYEQLVSLGMDEIDNFRNAYMFAKGVDIDEETFEIIKELGLFNDLPKDAEIGFITKNIDDTFNENTKKTLNDDIYKHTATVDMNDDRFSGGAESGESRKWKLIPLENKAIIKERKIGKALRQLFKVLTSAWAKKGYQMDYLDIYWSFNRNLPLDLLYLADVSQKLQGQVSEDTRLGAMAGLVDDIEYEKQKMEEDKKSNPYVIDEE